MATTQTRGPRASDLPYYVWEVPGKRVSIQLHFDAIDRMYPEIMRGLGALKRRGAEVGGILLGRSDSQGTVIIEDCEAVPSEYLTGPSYNLSENDLIAFEAAIARRQSKSAGGLGVVGFYRSHTRDELYMDDADMALARSYFPDDGNVFLLVKPFATRTSIAGFFFWEDGEINTESSYLQFPFHRGELGGGESRPVPAPAPAATSVRNETERPLPPYTPAGELRRQPFESAPIEEPFSNSARTSLSILSAPPSKQVPVTSETPWGRWLLPAVLAVAGVGGFFGYRELTTPKPQPPPASAPVVETTLPLKLSVTEKSNQLEVTWDRNATSIVNASGGVLSITDDMHKKDLELSGAQLRTGRVLYSRLSGDVGLRLEVFGAQGNSVTESIRIVSTEPVAPRPEVIKRTKPVSPPAEDPSDVERSKTTAKRPRAKSGPVSVPPPAVTPPPAEVAAPEVELQRPARRR